MLSMSILSAVWLLFVDNSSIPAVKVLQDLRRSADMAPKKPNRTRPSKAQSQKYNTNQATGTVADVADTSRPARSAESQPQLKVKPKSCPKL